MAREYAIPSTSVFLQDFGLNVTPPPAIRNRRVVIIGSAEDGPMYEPILVDKPEDAEIVWGRQSQGELVRGIQECWNAQEGYPNVVGVRIGNGKQAELNIYERDSYGVNEEQADNSGTGVVSLKLKARFPGAIYNQVTVRYDDRRNVAIYNPKTGLTSTFSVDLANPNNTSVDAHNVQELVDAINADRNLSSVIAASTSGVMADWEAKVRSTTTGIQQNANGIKIDLQTLIQQGVIVGEDEAYMVPRPVLPYGTGEYDANSIMKNLTATNNLIELDSIESVSFSEWEKLVPSANIANFAVNPLDGKGTSRWDTIQALYDYDGNSKYMHDPSGNVVSEFIESLDFVLIDEVPTDINGLDGTFTITSQRPLDDSEETQGSGVAVRWLSNNADYANYADIIGASGGYLAATCQGIATKDVSKTNNGQIRPSGYIRVWVSDDLDPNGNWTELPYDSNSGVYIDDFNDSKSIFRIGPYAYLANSGGYGSVYLNQRDGDTGVKFTNMAYLVDGAGNIRQDKYIRVTANTVKGFLNECDTLPQLEANEGTTLSHYFVRGQEVLFNRAPQYPLVVNYGTRIVFEPGTNVSLTDATEGELSFTDPELLPGPGGEALESGSDSFIRFKYKYLPNFPLITSATQALKNGTNGTKMTVKQREEELKKAYAYMRNFAANIWCPMEGFVDSIKEEYNQTTGLKEQQATSIASDIEDFLDEQSINSIQPHAVLGVNPIGDDITLGKIDTWAKNLVEVDLNNPIRGANVMASIQNKFISVAAFEPVFINIGRGQPYSANGQAAYAGLLASLPYDLSPTNKVIPGVNALRFDLSISQYEQMNAMRYVTMRPRNNLNPVIVNDVTAAPYGSDFVAWSTFSITAEASDRVKAIAEDYLGRPNSVEIRNAMDQDISNVLSDMSGLQAFNFSISSTIEQQVLGVVEIDLILVPIFTMKKIRTTVKLRKNLPTSA